MYISPARILFFIGVIITGIFEGLALGVFGPFEDTLYYTHLYTDLVQYGLYNTFLSASAHTGKVEPIILIPFYIETVINNDALPEIWFLGVNILLFNVILASSMCSFFDVDFSKFKPFYAYFVGVVVLFGYLSFAKEIYFWRAVLSWVFIIYMIKSSGFKKILWALVAILTHASALLFIPLIVIIKYASRLKLTQFFIVCFMLCVGLFMSKFLVMDILNLVAAGGSSTVYFAEGGSHTIKMFISLLFALVILLLVFREAVENDSIKTLYLFCLVTIALSLCLYDSYHFMSRISLPACLTIAFFPFFLEEKLDKYSRLRFFFAKLMVVGSAIPTLRLVFMMYTGSFAPA